MLNDNLTISTQKLTLKNRSCTRWCADANATKALRKNYVPIVNALRHLESDEDQTASTRNEARALLKKLLKLETIINTVVWDVILQRLNQASKLFQSVGKLEMVSPIFKSLIEFIQSVRNDYEKYEKEALEIFPENAYEVKRKKVLPRNKFLDDGQAPEVDLQPRDKFITSCHYVLCDSLISSLTSRKIPYENLMKKFSCLLSVKSNSTLQEDAEKLVRFYPSDLGEEFPDELEHFRSIMDKDMTPSEMLHYLKNFNLSSAFANVETALRIYLTIPISNCTGERSFSLLKRLKSPLRSFLQQQTLSHLSVLCLNSNIIEKLNYDSLIDSFAEKKVRKKPLKNI